MCIKAASAITTYASENFFDVCFKESKTKRAKGGEYVTQKIVAQDFLKRRTEF